MFFLVQTRSSGGSTTCVCDLRSMVPIFDLIAGVLSKSTSFILYGTKINRKINLKICGSQLTINN